MSTLPFIYESQTQTPAQSPANSIIQIEAQGRMTVSQLRSALTNALNVVRGTNAWLAASGSKESAVAYLEKSAPVGINALENALNTRVLKGDTGFPMPRWIADANTLGAQIADSVKGASGYSSWAIVTSTLGATATQVANAADAAVSASMPVIGLVALGLVALAVVMVLR